MPNGMLAYHTTQPSLGGTTGRQPRKPRLANALNGIRPAPYVPQYPTATPDQAVAMGRQDVATPQGAMRAGNWNLASRLLNQQDVAGGQQILANRAAGNAQLRQQMLGRFGNRGAATGERMLGMQTPAPAVAPPVPAGFVDRGERTAPVVVGGLGHRILRATPETIKRDEDLRKYGEISTDENGQEVVRPIITGRRGVMDPRRQQYLSGTGEFAMKQLPNGEFTGGGGPMAESQQALRKANVVAKAIQRSQDRRWRMAGGPQQQMLYNQMISQNPALALGMMRNQMQGQELGLAREQGQQMYDLQKQQGEERLAEIRGTRGDRYDEAVRHREELRAGRYAELRDKFSDNLSEEQIGEMVNRDLPPLSPSSSAAAAPNAVSGAPSLSGAVGMGSKTTSKPRYKARQPIPTDLLPAANQAQESGDWDAFRTKAIGFGYDPGDVEQMFHHLNRGVAGIQNRTTYNPNPQGFWGALGTTALGAYGAPLFGFRATDRAINRKWKNWWKGE